MFKLLFVVMIALFLVSPAWGAQSTAITPENAASVQQIALLEGHTGPVFTLAFSPDGARLVSGGSGDDYTVILWDVAAAAQMALLEGHEAQIAAVGFNADGSQVETASYDGTVRLWDTATGAALETIDQTSAGGILFIDNLNTFFNPDGTKLFYVPDAGSGVYAFDLATREESDSTAMSPEVFMSAGLARVTQDGATLAVEEIDGGPIHLIDVATRAETSTLARTDAESYYFSALEFSPDGKIVAAVDDMSSVIQLWDAETGQATFALSGHAPNDDGSGGVYGLAFSPDGRLLASASYDQTVRLWDVATGAALIALPTSDENGSGVVAWSPDGSLLASANLDGTIQIWGLVG